MAKNIRLSQSSRYVGTPLYQLYNSAGQTADSFAFGVWKRIDFPARSDDSVYSVQESDIGRLDLVAEKYYSDPLLWWVIADVNGISDPITDMFSGQELRIPSLGVVRAALQNAAAGRV